jgi:hypothetical protein
LTKRESYQHRDARAAQPSEFDRGVVAWVIVAFVLIGLMELPLLASVSRDAAAGLTALSATLSKRVAGEPTSASLSPAADAATAAAPAQPNVAARPAPQARGGSVPAGAAAQAAPAAPAAPASPAAPQTTAAPNTTSAPQTAPAAPAPPQGTSRPQVSAPTAAPTAAPAATAAAPTAAPAATAAASSVPTSAPPAAPASIQTARAPAAYAVPAGAVLVSNSAGLTAALQRSTATDIALADGVYDNAAPFANSNGHRIYAEHLLGATLRAGITMSSNDGQPNAVIRGIAFDVTDLSKTFQGAIVFTWGPQQYGAQILDSTFQGHKVIGSAIAARQPDGVVVRRVVIRDFTDWGVLAATNVKSTVLIRPLLIEDADVAGISRAVPKSGEGRSEACVGVGNTGTVRRVKVRNCAWMGITTFNASHGSLVEDIDIDGTMVGLYIEHYTSRSTFQRMRIGPRVEEGVDTEGTDPNGAEWGGISSSIDNVIQDSVIDSTKVGVLLGWMTTRTTVRRVTFRNQYVAAITDYKGVNNAYSANDYTGIQAGAVPVSPVWWR